MSPIDAANSQAEVAVLWQHREWRCERAAGRLRLWLGRSIYADEPAMDAGRSTARSIEWLNAVRVLDDSVAAREERLSSLSDLERADLPGYRPRNNTARHPSTGETVRTWAQIHDNGWGAFVCDAPGGRFAIWSAPADAPPQVDQFEDTLHAAQEAARTSLRLRSLHFQCSPKCRADWTESADPPVAPDDRGF